MSINTKNLHFKDFIKLIPWIIIILSIGTQPSDLELIGTSKASTFNALRILSALIMSIMIIIFFFVDIVSNFIKKKNNINEKSKYFVYYLFLIYFIFQVFGYFLNFAELKDSDFEHNIYLIILSFAFIVYFFLIKKKLSSKTLKFFLFFLYFLICLSGVVFAIIHLGKSNLESANYFSLYNSVLSEHQFFLNHELPRVTGISRTLSILNIILIFLYFYNVKKKIKFGILLFILILSVLIFAFQSRGTIICFVLSTFFLIFLFNCETLKDKFLILTTAIILSYLSFETIRFITFEFIKNDNNEVIVPFDKDMIDSIVKDKNRMLNFTSSGRTELWKQGIKKFKKNNFFGYGPQADRYLLRENIKIHTTNNISNGYLYSFLSGGYFGFFVFLIIIINLCFFLYKSLFVNKIYNKNNHILEKLSLTIFFYFLIRLNFENSFAVFGIDFILIFTSIGLFHLNRNYNKPIL